MAKKKKGLRNINPGDTVEFLNYITPDHIIRAKYNTGNNGMDITDVPQNLNSYIVLGEGSGVTVEPLSVTSNGLYTAPMGKAYTPVDVNVPVPPSVTVESLSVTSNGTYTAPAGKAYSPVDVNVPATPSVTVESLSVTSNGSYTAPAGKAYSPVDVNVPQTTIESLSVTLNGTYNAPTGKAYDPVVVNVPQTTVESLSVTSNGTYTAPAGKAYSPVTVSVSGSGIDIGLQTPKANLLSMIYALNNGTAKTGTFTLTQTLPNTSVQIFDADDTTVTQFAIFKQGQVYLDTSNNPVQTYMMFWLQSSDVLERFEVPDTYKVPGNSLNVTIIAPNNDVSIETGDTWWVYAHWTFSNGILNVQAQYNQNATYTPFRANETYRWVAW